MSPYLIAFGLVVVSSLYGYWMGRIDGYTKGLDDGFNKAFDQDRK